MNKKSAFLLSLCFVVFNVSGMDFKNTIFLLDPDDFFGFDYNDPRTWLGDEGREDLLKGGGFNFTYDNSEETRFGYPVDHDFPFEMLDEIAEIFRQNPDDLKFCDSCEKRPSAHLGVSSSPPKMKPKPKTKKSKVKKRKRDDSGVDSDELEPKKKKHKVKTRRTRAKTRSQTAEERKRPFHKAIASNDELEVAWLLNEYGVNYKDPQGRTPLHVAMIEDASKKIFHLILNTPGIVIDAVDDDNKRPVEYAKNDYFYDTLRSLEAILNNTVGPFMTEESKENDYATKGLKLMINNRVGLNVVNSYVNTVLHKLIYVLRDMKERASMALAAGNCKNTVDVSRSEWVEKTTKIFENLIGCGANYNIANVLGRTVFFAAAIYNCPEMMSSLSKLGKSPELFDFKDALGHTIFHYAEQEGYERVKEFFGNNYDECKEVFEEICRREKAGKF